MSLNSKQSRVEELRRALRDAEADLAVARRAREAEPGPGSRVRILATFPSSPKQYEYLALRTGTATSGSHWYITGRYGTQTWDDIISIVDRADYEIQHLQFLN